VNTQRTRPDQPLTLAFPEIREQNEARVGGKAANLARLLRADVQVPPGFCVTTAAYDRFLAGLPDAPGRFDALEALDGRSVEAARSAAEAMRAALEGLPVPADVVAAVGAAWRAHGPEHPLAVRSSATAEDLPGASFAGQQDTYLNVQGEAALIDAVRRCWISLFTDRAVLYRARSHFGHRGVRLAVVVQRLIDPEVSGILFTADPITGHRQVASIDAGFGLGEALVGGLINADLYRVDRRRGTILQAQANDKAFAIRPVAGGGTRREPLPEGQRRARALDDSQVLALAAVGAKVEAHYGGVPQDIEWCLAGGQIYVVQARPITSLYPIPESARPDGGLRVFLSFGHLQMMLDPMPRLALEVWQLFFPAGKDPPRSPLDLPPRSRVMLRAGGRLYLDATPLLRVRPARRLLLGALAHGYETLGRHVAALVERPEFTRGRAAVRGVLHQLFRIIGPVMGRVPAMLLIRDPAARARALGRALVTLPRELHERVAARATPRDRLHQYTHELDGMFARLRRYLPSLMSGVIAHKLLARLARGAWAGDVRGDVDLLLRGLPGNVTTEMDLAVGDLTDLVRPHPELARLLQSLPWPEARARLPVTAGGPSFLAAFDDFLGRYGVRGAGEIDISRPRWRDDPSLLLRVITGGLSAGQPGAHRRQHQAHAAAGDAAAARLATAAGRGFLGPLRRWLVQRLARVARIGQAMREHPKFLLVQVLGPLRAEVLAAGETLASRGQIPAAAQVWHLGFEELADALGDPTLDLRERVLERAAAFERDRLRKPPIAMSSDGETPTLAPARSDLPAGALPGTAASSGVVEGLARVVTDPDRDVLQAGEILVALFTDPGWTPLFVHAAGLVTEVGGVMTHGAVVAREYGIPAVVSVESAVERIKTGQRIRLDGTRGFVQILEPA
jgi:phosphohistidine swiveling domain-containing protein